MIRVGVMATTVPAATVACLYFHTTPRERFEKNMDALVWKNMDALMEPLLKSIKDEPVIVQVGVTTIWMLSVVPLMSGVALIKSALDMSVAAAAGIMPVAMGHTVLFNSTWEPVWSRAMKHLGAVSLPVLLVATPVYVASSTDIRSALRGKPGQKAKPAPPSSGEEKNDMRKPGAAATTVKPNRSADWGGILLFGFITAGSLFVLASASTRRGV